MICKRKYRATSNICLQLLKLILEDPTVQSGWGSAHLDAEVLLVSLCSELSKLQVHFWHIINSLIVHWVLGLFTVVKSKKGPAITYSASYSTDSCPLAFSYCFSLYRTICHSDKIGDARYSDIHWYLIGESLGTLHQLSLF